jgi:chromosome segregation ATPase
MSLATVFVDGQSSVTGVSFYGNDSVIWGALNVESELNYLRELVAFVNKKLCEADKARIDACAEAKWLREEVKRLEQEIERLKARFARTVWKRHRTSRSIASTGSTVRIGR